MLVRRKVGGRGQIVLPKDVREHLGIASGTEITFDVRDDEVAIKPAKTPEEFLEEFLRSSRRIKIKGDAAKWFKETLDEQYEEEYGLR